MAVDRLLKVAVSVVARPDRSLKLLDVCAMLCDGLVELKDPIPERMPALPFQVHPLVDDAHPEP
jgi:hypothetical protein